MASTQAVRRFAAKASTSPRGFACIVKVGKRYGDHTERTAAMTDWVPFNLNQYVRIRLTNVGLHAYEQNWRRLGLKPPKLEPDAEGYVKMQAWEMCHYFGSSMGNGRNTPIETEIFFERQS